MVSGSIRKIKSRKFITYLAAIIPVSIISGSFVALFLWLLTQATHLRFEHPWLLFLLPLAGVAIHYTYQLLGKNAEKGNNLIIDEIHKPGGGVPKRMAPLVVLTTVMTHLFGGSAGREGTAVQVGGAVAQMVSRWFRFDDGGTSIILTSGIAAGFGAVFGTPLTGAVFAIEVLTLGKLNYRAMLPCLLAAFLGDATVSFWGMHHTAYHIDLFSLQPDLLAGFLPASLFLFLKVIIAGIFFGGAAWLFSYLVHKFKELFHRAIAIKWLIPVAGACIIILLSFVNGKPDYLGLGVEGAYPGAITIPSAFTAGGADTWSWLWKTIYTTVTLSSGFKGGEVTPLFYIGATLGNTLSELLNAPTGLFAALGFIAVFSGATNTPLACTIMGAELFGSEYLHFFAAACFVAYFFSGHTGIYSSQRIGSNKFLLWKRSSGLSLAQYQSIRKRYLKTKLRKYQLRRK